MSNTSESPYVSLYLARPQAVALAEAVRHILNPDEATKPDRRALRAALNSMSRSHPELAR